MVGLKRVRGAKVKRVADLTLDRVMLQDVLKRKWGDWQASPAVRSAQVLPEHSPSPEHDGGVRAGDCLRK
jgi:acyl carrier protein phosphodiesterase